jgi:phage portal protein BeeE
VLHGVPAADFGADELLYLPRNVRSHRLCGFSPVEQIALTVNIALRRERATLDYYNTGSVPNFLCDAAEGMEGRSDKAVPGLFRRADGGNLARRRMINFMPADFKLTETR